MDAKLFNRVTYGGFEPEPLMVSGTGRVKIEHPMDERTLEVYLNRPYSDDEMRLIHDALRRAVNEVNVAANLARLREGGVEEKP